MESTSMPQGQDGSMLAGRDVIRSLVTALRTMVMRRWLVLAVTTIIVFAIGVILAFTLPASYSALARIKIDPSRSAALGDPDKVDRPDQSIIDTEVTVIRSRDIARAVIADLNLDRDPEFVRGMPLSPAKAGADEIDTRNSAIADRLLNSLSADRDKMTYIVDISYKGRNPQTVAEIANAFAREYIKYSRGKRTGAAGREEESLQERLKGLSREALVADQKLAQYRAETGTVSQGTTVTDQQIASVSTQLATAQSEAAAASSNLAVAKRQIASGGIDAVSAVLGSNVIGTLRAQRAELVKEQGEIDTRYGPRFPSSIKIRQQIASTDEQIADEAKRVVGGLESEASAAAARADSLKLDLDRLKGQQSVNTMASALADSYQRQAEAAHSAYNRMSELASSTSQLARSSFSQAQVVELAEVPLYPSSPNRKVMIPGALALAILIGLVTISIQEMLVRGLRSIGEVEQLGLSVLAVVPKLERRRLRNGVSAASMIVTAPMSSFSEAYRVLRQSLTDVAMSSTPRIVAMVSMLPAEGKTNSTLALARIMALSGERTLLIDADLRRAGVREAAAIDPMFGLVEVLQNQRTLEEAIVRDVIKKLDILAVSASTFTTDNLLGGIEWRRLLDYAAQHYDRIIIDTAPLLHVAETRPVAALANAVVVVIRWSETPASVIRTGLGWLAQDGAPVVGAVFSMVDSTLESYGGMYYSKDYNRYYQ